MNNLRRLKRVGVLSAATAAIISLAASAGMVSADEIKLMLSGDMEVPAVKTAAKGSGTIMINSDMTVNGSVTTTGVMATMAHIHQGAAGTNGPVIIPLTKSGDYSWMVPANAKLTEAQYKAYKAGELYVNVHSAENKGGEIRAQLK